MISGIEAEVPTRLLVLLVEVLIDREEAVISLISKDAATSYLMCQKLRAFPPL